MVRPLRILRVSFLNWLAPPNLGNLLVASLEPGLGEKSWRVQAFLVCANPNGRSEEQSSRSCTAVAGLRDHRTGEVRAKVVTAVDKPTLRGHVVEHAEFDAVVYTDQALVSRGLAFHHEVVNHARGEYGHPEGVTTNGLGSPWASLMRAKKGGSTACRAQSTCPADVREFVRRHNARKLPAREQMGPLAAGRAGRRPTYADLTANTGQSPGVRS